MSALLLGLYLKLNALLAVAFVSWVAMKQLPDLLRRFLDVLDDLQRVSALDPSEGAVSTQSVVEGIDLVERKFSRILEDAGVELVDPAPGARFDPPGRPRGGRAGRQSEKRWRSSSSSGCRSSS